MENEAQSPDIHSLSRLRLWAIPPRFQSGNICLPRQLREGARSHHHSPDLGYYLMRTPVALPPLELGRVAMLKQRGFEQTQSLEERLAEEEKRLREQAALIPRGPLREQVMRQARQCETGSHMSDWLQSPGLQPPD